MQTSARERAHTHQVVRDLARQSTVLDIGGQLLKLLENFGGAQHDVIVGVPPERVVYVRNVHVDVRVKTCPCRCVDVNICV